MAETNPTDRSQIIGDVKHYLMNVVTHVLGYSDLLLRILLADVTDLRFQCDDQAYTNEAIASEIKQNVYHMQAITDILRYQYRYLRGDWEGISGQEAEEADRQEYPLMYEQLWDLDPMPELEQQIQLTLSFMLPYVLDIESWILCIRQNETLIQLQADNESFVRILDILEERNQELLRIVKGDLSLLELIAADPEEQQPLSYDEEESGKLST